MLHIAPEYKTHTFKSLAAALSDPAADLEAAADEGFEFLAGLGISFTDVTAADTDLFFTGSLLLTTLDGAAGDFLVESPFIATDDAVFLLSEDLEAAVVVVFGLLPLLYSV